MKSLATTSAMMLVSLAVTGASNAQNYVARQPVRSPRVIQHHASTFLEGLLRGRADLARAAGEYNLNTSLARIRYEEARSKNIENRKKHAAAFFEMRDINREARKRQRGARPKKEDLERFARQAAPKRLNAYEYQPAVGSLNWPTALLNGQFLDFRSAIDELVKNRSANESGIGTESHTRIRSLTEQMTSVLKQQIHELRPMDFVAAKNFLVSLEYEYRRPIAVAGVSQ